MANRVKESLKRLGGGLAEFFNPRDWVPQIPLPPGKCRGEGCQSLFEAIEGFRIEEKK